MPKARITQTAVVAPGGVSGPAVVSGPGGRCAGIRSG